jgi:hypothetical protein
MEVDEAEGGAMTDDGDQKRKMLAGELYLANDAGLAADRRRAKVLCQRYNQAVVDFDRAALRELFGYATDAYLEPPFFCDYGYNMKLGKRVDANHNLVERQRAGGRRHRRQRHHWRGQRGDEIDSGELRRGREPVPGAAVPRSAGC